MVLKGVHGVKDKTTLQFLTRTQTNPQVCGVRMSFGSVILVEAEVTAQSWCLCVACVDFPSFLVAHTA